MIMNENEDLALDEALRKFEAKDDSGALQQLRNLASRVGDPWDKAWLKYYEIRMLVDMHNGPEARHQLDDLQKLLISLVGSHSTSDGPELDAPVSLPMLARHAEIRVVNEEGRDSEALHLIEELVSAYPKQLSLPEFKGLAEEIATLRGFLLGSLGRWGDARLFLEGATPPEAWRAQHSHYLGRCYYENKEYDRAKNKLTEAINLGLETPTEGEAHYVLGLVEYHLSNMRAAKREFELSVKTADPGYLGEEIWGWLESTSRALGLQAEAENYRILKAGSPPKAKTN